MSENEPGPAPIQIWQPESVDGKLVFTRPAPGPLGDHYAARRTIPADCPAGVRRVCLFGESTAAGYLSAPWLTPSVVLEEMLDRAAGPGRYEVIDLARTNETLAGMETAMRSALQLDPAIFVVFAGNNWTLLETPEISPYAPDAPSRQRFGETLAAAGMQGAIQQALRLRTERAGAVLAEVAELAGARGIRVVLVVPEANLADWADGGPVHWLAGDGNARWHALLGQARGYLIRGEWARAFEAGEALLALDEGKHPAAFHVLARAKAGLGEPEKASIAARAAVDALHYPAMGFLGAPRITSTGQALLREGGRVHGLEVVDLPELFRAWTGSPYPGRRLFLDYCHLTVEGMKLAAAGIAAAIAPETGRTWQELAKTAPAPDLSPVQDAAAMFGAALHTAHRMPNTPDRSEVIEYRIEAALEADPGVEARMLDLAEARAGGGRIHISPAHARNLAAAAPVLYSHGWEYPHLDAAVLEAIQAVLARRRSPGADRLLEIMIKAAPPDGEPLELADPYYLAEPLERPFPELGADTPGDGRAFLRFHLPAAEFAFLARGGSGRVLSLCARLSAGAGPAVLWINGNLLGEVELDRSWRLHRTAIPGDLLVPGLNRLRLDWPALQTDGDRAFAEAAARLKAGGTADLFPVFGELYSARLEAIF